MFKTKMKPLALTIAAVALLAGCGDKEEKKSPSQVLATVNKTEITVHQLNTLLGRVQAATPAMKQQMLDQLIDQELLVQKATELKLDREPNVLQSIESAKRQILAQAAAERVLGKPEALKPADIDKFYNDNPALFAERKNYEFIVFSVDKKSYNEDLTRQLDKAGNAQQVKSIFTSAQIKFSENEVKRTAEQLPLTLLPKFSAMKTGDIITMPEGDKVVLLLLKESILAPVPKENASPLIQRYLQNDKVQTDAKIKIKALRDAAKIEYTQKFAEQAPGASSPAAAADDGIKAGLKGLK
ncbi:peptidyl-prolyl cis-trans isomerase, EpsD family [Iodobacter sp. HSC-16F04]|uniref:Peptidyl-prolyl cis-trans isomerase, EpsD family n=1 Tax=Iodobacter violaceini TaxID=3044271 RepID=A0ABX0KQL0_9NEIS|nr:EpsD family peptidyl-prolyl cis-trans isomerase [Iodobacter violacea]NHQ85944.1 peptidyl-prolyl cis-trans isomerase, EpsD family [Iodobacter violacea]